MVLLVAVAGLLLLRSSQTPAGQSSGGVFGFGTSVSNVQTTGGGLTNVVQNGAISGQKVFKIASGPVAGATFIQTFAPTTTVARYVMQDNGHVLDLAIDVPGAAAKPASNTTIPGVVSAVWGKNGTSTVLQYTENTTLKSVYIAFAPATTTGVVSPAHIQFLPNNITSLAMSPDGASVAYLLPTSAGTDGYVAKADGTNARRLFSVPLSQVTLSWPEQNSLLVQTKGAIGVPGIALYVNVKTSGVSPLLYTSGLSAIANSVFSKVIYQSSPTKTSATTYAHDVATGKDTPLANNPLPEKCAWSVTSLSDIYCALSLDATAANYLDLWHQGLIQNADSIVKLDANTGIGTVITLPGDGGVSAPIDQIGVSFDGKYLYFITRGDHSLWGVRLTQ